jgi:aspartate racemase
MTGHFCIKQLKAISPLPIVDALPAVDEGIVKHGYKKVGLIGTNKVMSTRLYGAVTSAEIVLPDPIDRDRTNDAYLAMATAARVTEEQRAVFFDVGERLSRDHGAEAIMLGGTDLFLAFDGRDCGFEVIDCAQLHVDTLFRKSQSSR